MKKERIIFGVIIALAAGIYANAESCSSVGSTEVKYTASGCSYTTQTRTCCSDKTWSGWGDSCKTCAESSKPATSQSCGNCGTQSRTVTCNTSTGAWETASWGSCTGEGVCSPGQTKAQGSISNAVYICTSKCAWPTYYSCSNTADLDYCNRFDNCYWSSKFCDYICCRSGAEGYDAKYGPSCRSTSTGRPDYESVCGLQ